MNNRKEQPRRLPRVGKTQVLVAMLGSLCLGVGQANAQSGSLAEPAIQPWPSSTAAGFPKPWVSQFHPKVKKHTVFTLQQVEGQTVARASSDGGYGSMVHAFSSPVPIRQIQWRWQVEQHPTGANLRTKEGDDAGAKLCLFVAIDESKLGVGTRMKMGAARLASGESLPAATLCYAWAPAGVPSGEVFNNPFTDRVRNIVVRSAAESDVLVTEQRDVQADARRAFGAELPEGPVQFLGVALGADADNTQSKAVGVFGAIVAK